MTKREVFTLKEVEYDISYSLKNAPERSESSYKKLLIPCGVLGVLLAILSIFQPKIGLIGLLILAIVAIVSVIFELLFSKHRVKSVSIDDYEIDTAILSYAEEEHYKQIRAGVNIRHSRKINNYTLHFENGKSFRLPKDNYAWSKERSMSDFAIFHSSHRGDLFIVAVKKDSFEIAMAYPAEFFEYKK